MMKLIRFKGNPILKPIKNHNWEKFVYNPAAIFLQDKIHIVYRAMGKDGISRFGYASSKDGFHIDERVDKPIFIPERKFEEKTVKFRNSGCEDPRLTKIGNRIYMVYAATNGRVAHTSLASLNEKDFLNKKWKWKRHGIIFPFYDSRDSILFPEKVNGKYLLHIRFKPNIYVCYSRDLKKWSQPKLFMAPRDKKWDCLKIGDNTTPIKIENKWLIFYHGVEPKKKKSIYKVGFYITDKESKKVLFRSDNPVLEPKTKYEKFGQVNNVVFPGGAVKLDEKLFVYYGGADSVVCVATANISKLLSGVF